MVIRARLLSSLTAMILLVTLTLPPVSGQVPALGETYRALSVTPNDRFGIVHISAVASNQITSSDKRYQQAKEAGAKWNRWVFYWHEIETTDGLIISNPDQAYRLQDQVVDSDVAHGFNIDAVLLGTPGWITSASVTAMEAAPFPEVGPRPRQAEAVSIKSASPSPATYPPRSLGQPVFTDGTDIPGPAKSINMNNHWARFVYTTVNRYKDKIKYWEIWNEPDFPAIDGGFWASNPESYYRLLKVAYLAAKTADPTAKIMMGGLTHYSFRDASASFLRQVLALIKADPLAATNNFFFDVIPLHFYSRPFDLWTGTVLTRTWLREFGMSANKEIWVNETNAPACGDRDLQGAIDCGDRNFKGSANLSEQADFIIQAFAYGFAAGLTRILIFQLYDDGWQYYDGTHSQGYGLIRNGGSPRPAYTAYQVAVTYLSNLFSGLRTSVGDVERITFGTPQGKVTVLWDKSPQATEGTVAASAPTATLVYPDGRTEVRSPLNNVYRISLPGATDNKNFQDNLNDYIIGGSPRLLVESLPPDTTPPTSMVNPLPAQSQKSFMVSWTGSDVGWGIVNYDVQYRDTSVVGGTWQDWLSSTTATSATFNGTAGHTYEFRSRARDWAGNVEAFPATADAQTTIVQPNVVTNGDFESITDFGPDAGWNVLGSTAPKLSNLAYTGLQAALLGDDFKAEPGQEYGNSTIWQKITVPDTLTKPILSFVYRIATTQPGRAWFEVKFHYTPAGGEPVVVWVIPRDTVRQAPSWTKVTYDLTSYKGKQIELYFNVVQWNDAHDLRAYLDDVSIDQNYAQRLLLPLILER